MSETYKFERFAHPQSPLSFSHNLLPPTLPLSSKKKMSTGPAFSPGAHLVANPMNFAQPTIFPHFGLYLVAYLAAQSNGTYTTTWTLIYSLDGVRLAQYTIQAFRNNGPLQRASDIVYVANSEKLLLVYEVLSGSANMSFDEVTQAFHKHGFVFMDVPVREGLYYDVIELLRQRFMSQAAAFPYDYERCTKFWEWADHLACTAKERKARGWHMFMPGGAWKPDYASYNGVI